MFNYLRSTVKEDTMTLPWDSYCMRHFRHEIKSLFRRIGGFIPLSMAFKVQVKELQNSCILRVSIFTPCKPIDDDDNNNIVTKITLFWTLFYIYISSWCWLFIQAYICGLCISIDKLRSIMPFLTLILTYSPERVLMPNHLHYVCH